MKRIVFGFRHLVYGLREILRTKGMFQVVMPPVLINIFVFLFIGWILVRLIGTWTEVSFGEDVLNWFDENEIFEPSEIEIERKNIITGEFNQLHDNLEMSPYLQLEFRNSEKIGPNAFALPGGTVVITDQMFELDHVVQINGLDYWRIFRKVANEELE